MFKLLKFLPGSITFIKGHDNSCKSLLNLASALFVRIISIVKPFLFVNVPHKWTSFVVCSGWVRGSLSGCLDAGGSIHLLGVVVFLWAGCELRALVVARLGQGGERKGGETLVIYSNAFLSSKA